MDALWFGCIPVFIADHYVPPLYDIIPWSSFSVAVPERQVSVLPNLASLAFRPEVVGVLTGGDSRGGFVLCNVDFLAVMRCNDDATPLQVSFLKSILHSFTQQKIAQMQQNILKVGV